MTDIRDMCKMYYEKELMFLNEDQRKARTKYRIQNNSESKVNIIVQNLILLQKKMSFYVINIKYI